MGKHFGDGKEPGDEKAKGKGLGDRRAPSDGGARGKRYSGID